MNYVKNAVRTVNEDLNRKEWILNGALGLCGESGEVADVIKKYAFQGHVLDLDELKDELGDVFWYIALLCDVCGFTFEEIQEHNIDKLKKRYPEGFEEEKSVNRK